jgi:hypothetical protein
VVLVAVGWKGSDAHPLGPADVVAGVGTEGVGGGRLPRPREVGSLEERGEAVKIIIPTKGRANVIGKKALRLSIASRM